MKRAAMQPTLDIDDSAVTRFEGRKNQYGVWCVFFGTVNAGPCMNDRVAKKVASQLNEDPEALALGSQMPPDSYVSRGATAAMSQAKDGGEVSVAACVAYALHMKVRFLRAAIEEPGSLGPVDNQPTVERFEGRARPKGPEAAGVFFGSAEVLPCPSIDIAVRIAEKLNENPTNVQLGHLLLVESRAWLWPPAAASLISPSQAIKTRDTDAAALLLFSKAHDLLGGASS